MDCRRQNNDFDLITFGPISPVGPGFPLGPTAPCDEEAGKLTLVETIYLRNREENTFGPGSPWLLCKPGVPGAPFEIVFETMPQVMTII